MQGCSRSTQLHSAVRGSDSMHTPRYCGWTKSCTTLKPWENIVCWYLQGHHDSRVSWVVQGFVHQQNWCMESPARCIWGGGCRAERLRRFCLKHLSNLLSQNKENTWPKRHLIRIQDEQHRQKWVCAFLFLGVFFRASPGSLENNESAMHHVVHSCL